MIPVFKPFTISDTNEPIIIHLVRDKKKNIFCWSIEKTIPTLKKNIHDIEINESIFMSIMDDMRRYYFLHLFTNILLYNNLDMGHLLKYNFEVMSDCFQFTYFFDEDESITIPAMIKPPFIRVTLTIVSNRPVLKIVVRDIG